MTFSTGGNGDDFISGGDGNDSISGGAGNDSLLGGAGNDNIYTHSGNDYAHGGAGNDTMICGQGYNEMWGGSGADRFLHQHNGGWGHIRDFAAEDSIVGDHFMVMGGHTYVYSSANVLLFFLENYNANVEGLTWETC